jgi:AmiR/NasT family two-component response regulator
MGTIAPPNNTLKGKRILLVEDEVLIAMQVEDELLDAGAHIVGTASSIAEALRIIEAARGGGRLRGQSCSRVEEPSPPVVISTAQPSRGDLMTSNTSGLSAVPILASMEGRWRRL